MKAALRILVAILLGWLAVRDALACALSLAVLQSGWVYGILYALRGTALVAATVGVARDTSWGDRLGLVLLALSTVLGVGFVVVDPVQVSGVHALSAVAGIALAGLTRGRTRSPTATVPPPPAPA